jgi:Kdo2-lipid IVA lauroyltransferase/acyltransferase
MVAISWFDALHYAVFRLAMAQHGRLRTNLEYWVARSVLGFLSRLPLSLAIRVGSAFGRLGSLVPKLRRTGLRNLGLAFPQLSSKARARLLRGCFANLGRLLGVFSHFRDASAENLREKIHCEGMEHIQLAARQRRGVILFTGHVGAWELSSFGPSLYGYPFSFLVRRIDNPKIEALIDGFRTALGNRTIDKRLAAREMLRILKNGEALGILVDLNALDREAIFVDFFGVKAATTFVVAKLALRTGAPVIPIFSPWNEALQRFTVQIGEPISFERSGDEEEDTRRATQLLTKTVEDCVRLYPDQWLWVHRRWKTRPSGEPNLYD